MYYLISAASVGVDWSALISCQSSPIPSHQFSTLRNVNANSVITVAQYLRNREYLSTKELQHPGIAEAVISGASLSCMEPNTAQPRLAIRMKPRLSPCRLPSLQNVFKCTFHRFRSPVVKRSLKSTLREVPCARVVEFGVHWPPGKQKRSIWPVVRIAPNANMGWGCADMPQIIPGPCNRCSMPVGCQLVKTPPSQ